MVGNLCMKDSYTALLDIYNRSDDNIHNQQWHLWKLIWSNTLGIEQQTTNITGQKVSSPYSHNIYVLWTFNVLTLVKDKWPTSTNGCFISLKHSDVENRFLVLIKLFHFGIFREPMFLVNKIITSQKISNSNSFTSNASILVHSIFPPFTFTPNPYT